MSGTPLFPLRVDVLNLGKRTHTTCWVNGGGCPESKPSRRPQHGFRGGVGGGAGDSFVRVTTRVNRHSRCTFGFVTFRSWFYSRKSTLALRCCWCAQVPTSFEEVNGVTGTTLVEDLRDCETAHGRMTHESLVTGEEDDHPFAC